MTNFATDIKQISEKLLGASKWLIRPNINLCRNHKDTVIVAGDGRSGTTWLSDIINYKNEYRFIFEPFHPVWVGRIFEPFPSGLYIRPENQKKEYIRLAKLILTGRFAGMRIDMYNRKSIYNKILIKTIFGNLLLKWIKVNFPEVRIVMLLRHPCAVAHSKLNLKRWHWADPADFFTQKELAEDFLFPFKNELDSVKTDFERHIFTWCILNYIPLRQFTKEEACLVFYENLCEKPEHEINRLFSFFHENYDEEIYIKLKKPSLLTKKHSAIIADNNLISNWREHLTKKQVERAMEILRIFELDKIYTDDLTPNVDAAYEILTKNQKNKQGGTVGEYSFTEGG